MAARRTSFYLDKRNSQIFGVASGIADYLGQDVVWIRIAFVVGTVCGLGFLPILYIVTACLADPKPYSLYEDSREEREFWTKVRVAPQRTIRDTRASFRETERRLRDIEAYVTSSNSRLAGEIDRLK